MIINTSRFGQVEVEDQRIIHFPKGILGFPNFQRFVLIEPDEESYFYWLQSAESPDLAFVVTDPNVFVENYKVPIKPEQMEDMGLASIEEAQVLVIVNKRGSVLTGNLQGPLVIDMTRRVGQQLVLSDSHVSTRVPLVELGRGVETISV